MESSRRDRVLFFVLLPAVLFAVGVLAYFTIQTTFQLDKLGQQAVFESTYSLATERADRLDKRIITEDNVVFAIADPSHLSDLPSRWLPTAQRETPTVRAILVLDESLEVLAFASRAGGAWADEETFRRLLVTRMAGDMKLALQPLDELHHLHREYNGQSYLVSYWQRVTDGRRYIVVAWHDVGRIVKDTFPALYPEANAASGASRVNVVDEDGRIIFGPPLNSGEFTVGVSFPTTLYNWRLQVAPTKSAELRSGVQSRKTLEITLVSLSCIVIIAGVIAILLAVQRERKMNALKSEFVANVSHELKTPLALVRMFAEMLQSGRVSSDEKRREYLDIIVNESERLSSLIENVLDFARVERGRDAYEFADGDVSEPVRKAVQAVKIRAERESVTLEYRQDDDLPLVRNDERAVELLVMNLVDNAIKYASSGKVVRVSVVREADEVVLRVSDDGPGIRKAERERIFERFVRGTTARTDFTDGSGKVPIRGSGIGLALVKHIAEAHGGTVSVDGDQGKGGKGSTFVVRLPALPSHQTANAH
ncbi:hypothetical protein BH09MYX1_BH09MYX1_07400 [soil metagenome]